MKYLIGVISSLFFFHAASQTDSIAPALKVHGYIDLYYSYDFNKPPDHHRPDFLYSYNRHNELNLNLGIIGISWKRENARAAITLGAGTYVNANYANEPDVLKNIYEASAGIKISKKSRLWIDAGIFSSHLGFESAMGKDNQTLSRSIMAENSPYYETGAKISYASQNEKWFLSFLLLNGWQRIRRVDGNNTPAFGHQLTYSPNEKLSLNSSSFIGNDKPDSMRMMRYFHNLYARIQCDKSFSLVLGFDIGAEQKMKGSSSYNVWYTPVVIGRYAMNRSAIAVRMEYYSDRNYVIISPDGAGGFSTWGFSLNYDLSFNEHVVWRIESRLFSSKEDIFLKDALPKSTNFNVTTSISVGF
jgi:hypothetical protein